MDRNLWTRTSLAAALGAGVIAALALTQGAGAQDKPPAAAAAAPAAPTFAETFKKMSAEKEGVDKAARALLEKRYDLSNRPAKEAKGSRGRPLQEGIRVKLREGATWEALAAAAPAEVREKGLWPEGFLPLPHANHPEGGMLFPHATIEDVKAQTGRDLQRFDLDFELPDHLIPEFPPAIFLTTHPEAGDVSKGRLVTLTNYYELFHDLLNPKQLEGLRVLLTPFPQQQFNATDDRRSTLPSQGVACLDCHVNGHTNSANHLAGDARPQEMRHRIETPTLRGVFVQRLFGSQRALKSVEDFTEFEQRGAYFDGDPIKATFKGVNILERGSQVHFMAEMQELFDFPPAPKLDIFGRLDPSLASEPELRGEALFHGKAKCATCHPAPYFTDNLMHDLKTERFYKPVTIAGHTAVGDGKIKTFPLRGLRDSAPYLHDGRLLTIEDSVEFFNVVVGAKLTAQEKADLVAFLRTL